jgi:hypothetical protein
MYVCSARGWRTENSPPPPPQLDYKPDGSNYSLMMAELQEAQKPMEIRALWGPFLGHCGVPFWSLVGGGPFRFVDQRTHISSIHELKDHGLILGAGPQKNSRLP